jgi:hypothetical protein
MRLLAKLLQRFRFPATLPQEITQALGIRMADPLSFDEFFKNLVSKETIPSRLRKMMPRPQAEAPFSSAQRKERFHENTIFSYYFNEGWLIFILRFDEQGRLRGLELRHERIQGESGLQLPLLQ